MRPMTWDVFCSLVNNESLESRQMVQERKPRIDSEPQQLLSQLLSWKEAQHQTKEQKSGVNILEPIWRNQQQTEIRFLTLFMQWRQCWINLKTFKWFKKKVNFDAQHWLHCRKKVKNLRINLKTSLFKNHEPTVSRFQKPHKIASLLHFLNIKAHKQKISH